MKKLNVLFFIFLLIGLMFAFTSCSKDEGCTDKDALNYNADAEEDDGSCKYEELPTEAEEPQTYMPSFEGAFGTLVAINTITAAPGGGFGGGMDMDMKVGVAVAVFSDDGGENFVSAGTVTCNGEELNKADNNAYTSMPDPSNPTGIDFGNTVYWEATGADWPSLDVTESGSFPELGKINDDETVKISEDFTLSTESVDVADSVVFAVYGPQNSLLVIKETTETEHTFSAAEMETLGSGAGFIQVTAVKYHRRGINNRNHWFIKQTVRSNTVTLK